jgi:Photosynthesis affected mutant 68
MAAGKGQRRNGNQPSAAGMAPKTARTGKATSKGNPQAIPPAVANRMARRVAIATGIPTLLGMATFVVSYLVVSRGLLDIPPAVTLVTSGGFFLLGLVGLSYGVLSASWEVAPGSLLGVEQIGLNVGRLRGSLKQPPAAS